MKVDINIWYTDQQTMISNHAEGISTVNFIISLLKRQGMAKHLIVLIKKILKKHNYNNRYLGGLSSYAIILMVDAFLCTYGRFSTIAEAFLGLLRHYGKDMDYSRYGIAWNSVNMSYVMIEPDSQKPQLVIIDPLDPTCIVTQASYRYDEIRKCFMQVHDRIRALLEHGTDNILDNIYNAKY